MVWGRVVRGPDVEEVEVVEVDGGVVGQRRAFRWWMKARNGATPEAGWCWSGCCATATRVGEELLQAVETLQVPRNKAQTVGDNYIISMWSAPCKWR